MNVIFKKSTGAALNNMIRTRRTDARTCLRVVQAVINIIVLQLQTDGVDRFLAQAFDVPAMRQIDAGCHAPVTLIKLITLYRIVEKVGEVGIQIQTILNHVGIDAGGFAGAGLTPFARHAMPLRRAAIAVVDRAKTRQRAGLQGAQGDLIGRVPFA